MAERWQDDGGGFVFWENHPYGHILHLNPTQIRKLKMSVRKCANYFLWRLRHLDATPPVYTLTSKYITWEKLPKGRPSVINNPLLNNICCKSVWGRVALRLGFHFIFISTNIQLFFERPETSSCHRKGEGVARSSFQTLWRWDDENLQYVSAPVSSASEERSLSIINKLKSVFREKRISALVLLATEQDI